MDKAESILVGGAMAFTFLKSKGIETKVQHPLLMPQQPAFNSNIKGSFPYAKKIVKKILCIPIHENLKQHEKEYVVKSIQSFYILRAWNAIYQN